MAIRIFLNVWTEEESGGLVQVKDPIDEALANISLSAPVDMRTFHARRSLANRPDKLFLIKVIKGNLTSAEWTQIDSIPGVRMLPAFRFDMPISEVPTTIKNNIKTKLNALGVPREVFDGAATVGGFFRNVLTWLNDDYLGYGDIEMEPAEWE